MDLSNTYVLLGAVAGITPEHTFFKKRYFPTNITLDIFGTAKVLADYKTGSQKRAPFVLPRIGGKSIGREGFSTFELEPGNISVSMPLTIDHLKNRGFGEALVSNKTPAEREQTLLLSDLRELSARISRTEEWLAVQTMLDNGCTMKHETESEGVYEEIPVQFYDGENNPALFTPAEGWTNSVENADGNITIGNWYKDICSMVKMLTSRGLPAVDLVVSSDVGEFLLGDIWILKALDNRRMEFGNLDPSVLTDYVTEVGTFNFNGRKLRILINDGTFEGDNGETVPYMAPGSVIVTAPDCGKGLYGGVTQLEADGQYHTYAGTRVPQHIFTMRPPVKETQLTSRPLLVPRRPSPWSAAKKVFD